MSQAHQNIIQKAIHQPKAFNAQAEAQQACQKLLDELAEAKQAAEICQQRVAELRKQYALKPSKENKEDYLQQKEATEFLGAEVKEIAERLIKQGCSEIPVLEPETSIQPEAEICAEAVFAEFDAALDYADPRFIYFDVIADNSLQDVQQYYRLEVKYSNYEPLKTQKPLALPEINLEDLFQKYQKQKKSETHAVREIWTTIISYSETSEELQKIWKNLYQLYQQNPDLYLVIRDKTKSQIPWEILQIEIGKHLGTCFTTVRIENELNTDYLIEAQHRCAGRGFAYVLDDTYLDKTEKSYFNRIQIDVSHKIQALKTHLYNTCCDYSLLYISCHGFYDPSDDSNDMALGCPNTPGEQLWYRRDLMIGHPMSSVQNSKSLVFINACKSASNHPIPAHNNDYLHSFPKIFLRHGARGVIGTLASVYSYYAMETARALLETTQNQTDNPLTVPEILRKIRTDAIAQLHQLFISDFSEQASQEKEKLFKQAFTRFSYAYYGVPLLYLEPIQASRDDA